MNAVAISPEADDFSVTLDFKKELPRYWVATDDSGIERWFDKSKYQAEHDGDELIVHLSEKEWAKRLANVEPKEVIPTKVKKCLRCKHDFHAHKNMFICDPCKQTDDWKAGWNPFEP